MTDRRNELYFEEIGGNFQAWMSDYDVRRRIDLITRLLPRQASRLACLEVGCGTGAISQAIAPLVGQLTVSDLSEKLARRVGERLHVDWRKQDACALAAADGSFDLVISSECIEHTPAPRQALREMARVLRPGGILIVTSPNKLWYPALWAASALRIRKFAGNEVWLFPWEAARVLKQGGLAEVTMTGCHLFPWQLPLAKKVLPWFDRAGRFLYPAMINFAVRARRPGGPGGDAEAPGQARS